MLSFSIEQPKGIMVLKARGKLGKTDLTRLTKAASMYLETHQRFHGVLVHAQQFPDWESLAGLAVHLDFARAHHDRVKRIALVTDSALVELVAAFVKQLTPATLRRFAFADDAAALAWLRTR